MRQLQVHEIKVGMEVVIDCDIIPKSTHTVSDITASYFYFDEDTCMVDRLHIISDEVKIFSVDKEADEEVAQGKQTLKGIRSENYTQDILNALCDMRKSTTARAFESYPVVDSEEEYGECIFKPAVIITETVGETSVKTELATMEDYVDWLKLEASLNGYEEVLITNEENQKLITLQLTQEEIQTVSTLLAFVGDNQTVYNVINKFNPYVNQEELEDAFAGVELEIDNDLPLFERNIPMQENYMTIKIK